MNSKPWTQILKNFLRPAVALVFLFILIKKGPFQLDQLTFILSQPKVLAYGFVLLFIQFTLSALRWKKIVEILTPLSMKLAWSLNLIGQFFSFFIPGGVGGDVVKAIELSKSTGISKSDSLSTVFADRLLGLYSMVLFSAFFLSVDFFQRGGSAIQKYLYFSGILFVLMTMGLLFGPWFVHIITSLFAQRSNKLVETLQKIVTSFSLTFACFRSKGTLAKVISLSFVLQLTSIFFMLEVIKALYIAPPSFFIFFSLSCFGFLASAIPITPAGIGVGQAAFYFLFSSLGEDLGNAAVTAISMLQLFQLFYALIGGVLFSAKPFFKFDAKDLE